MKLYCATTNAGKLHEFRLADARIEPLPNLQDIPPSPEDGSTFEANAMQKALYYSRFTSELVFADDSGLEVDALHGAPGVHSARYAGGNASNNELLLERMQGLENRRARFVCVIALAREGGILGTYRGEAEGRILHEPQGEGGFGYDPLFFSTDLNRPFAELSEEEKLAVSHRGRALRKMLATAF